MNEEMNNNYNNTPNYNYEKKNNGVKTLLIVLIVLAVAILGLLSYKIFVSDKKNSNTKDNNVVENKDDKTTNSDNQNNKIEENGNNEKSNSAISSKLEGELKNQVKRLPLHVILNGNYDYKYIFESNAIFESLQKLSSEKNCKFDKNKVGYNGWSDVNCYKGEEIIKKVKELFNYNLTLKEKEYGGCQVHSLANFCDTMYYDSKNAKLVVINGDGTAGTVINTILDTTFNNNLYKIKYANASYELSNVLKEDDTNCNKAFDKDGKEHTLCSDKELNDYTLSHKDDFSQYEVSFKINSDDTYEFKDIKKINNI